MKSHFQQIAQDIFKNLYFRYQKLYWKLNYDLPFNQRMSRIEMQFKDQDSVTQHDLAEIKQHDIQILTAKGKNLRNNLQLISGEQNLKWLDVRNNHLSDQDLMCLEKLKQLQVLLLNDNNVQQVDTILRIAKSNKNLATIGLATNPIANDQQKIKILREELKDVKICIEPLDENIFQMKRKCLYLQLRSEEKDRELMQLKKQLFEDKSRTSLDLGRYLISLKIYCKNYRQLCHTLFSTLRKLNKQDPRIKQMYPNLPWNLIGEWPQNNFLQQMKIDCSQIQQILEKESIQYSSSLEIQLENILNEYYALKLADIFKICKLNLSYLNLNRLLEFLLGSCREYCSRSSEEYLPWIAVVFPYPLDIKSEFLKLLLETDTIQNLTLLQEILNLHKDAKPTEEQTTFLNQIKKISFKKVFQNSNKCTFQQSFVVMILKFFQKIMDLYGENQNLISANREQNLLFARFLFVLFDSSDVYYLNLLLTTGQMKNQDYFMRNMQKLIQIINLKKWLNSIVGAQQKIKSVQKTELIPTLAIFFKKVLGRPQFNISLIKKYFHRFNFQIIQKIVDSYERPQTLSLLISKFGDDFSFIRQSLISKQSTPKLIQMQKLITQNRILSSQQNRFVQTTLAVFESVNINILKNPVIQNLLSQTPSKLKISSLFPSYASFTLLTSVLQSNSYSVLVDQIVSTNNIDRLISIQNNCLLNMMREVIKVTDKTLQLVKRETCWFSQKLSSMKETKFYQRNQYIFDFLRLSYQLYLINLNHQAPSIVHKNLIDPSEIMKANQLKVYLQKINPKYFLSDYLLQVCKKQIRNIIFRVDQGVLTFDLGKFKQLSSNHACRYCFDEDFYEALQMIANTNGIYFVQVTNYQKLQKQQFNDKKASEMLLQAYHEQVLIHCLKRELMNLGQYSIHLQKAENIAKVKGFQLKLPLYQISKVVRTQIFQKSQFKNQLYKFFKSKIRTQTDRRHLLTLFAGVQKKLSQQEVKDSTKLEFVKQMFLLEQNKLCETFIKNISLLSSIQSCSKIYAILDWEFLKSFAKTNYLPSWQQKGIPEIEQRMIKYKRVLCRYLSDPSGFRGERVTLNRATDKLEDLILNQQIFSMLNKFIVVPNADKSGWTVILHQIHKCLQMLEKDNKIQKVQEFNYQMCLAVKKKLNHSGFLILSDYLMNGMTSQNRQEVEEVIDSINYKIQYYRSLNILRQILLQRQYNPSNYFKSLMKTLNILSTINILNTEIETQFLKNRYQLFHWQFAMMAPALNPQGIWCKILMNLQQEYGIYLQLIHYLDSRDATEGILILNQLFEDIYSQACCNDLIKRIQNLLSLSEETLNLIHKLTHFNEYLANSEQLTTKINQVLVVQTNRCDRIFDEKQLISCLRVLSLKGQYINRIQKMSNRLRNMLSDYDEQGLDIQQFLSFHKDKQSQYKLKTSLLQILSLSLFYKNYLYSSVSSNFYKSVNKSKILIKDNYKPIIQYLESLDYKKYFAARYEQPDLHMKFVILSEPHEVIDYFKKLILLYRRLIKDLSNSQSIQWQAAEFLHVAILTTIRLKTKYRMVVQQSSNIDKQLLIFPYRVYRNHLAHFIPSEKTLAGKKLNINSQQQMQLLFKKVDNFFQTVPLW